MGKRLFATLLLLVAFAAAGQTPAAISSPANGSTLGGSSQTFTWNAAPGAEMYQLWVGNALGAYDIGYYPPDGTFATSVTVENLPVDGRTLHVRLWSAINGAWQSNDFTYTAHTPAAAATITSPANGSSLASTTQTFQWNAAPGATLYQLWVGSTVGAYDLGYYPAAGTTGTSVTVSGLPNDGRTLHVRLWSAIDGAWVSRDSSYSAASPAAAIYDPANGATLTSSSRVFRWYNVPAASLYQMWIGSQPGGSDLASVTAQPWFGSYTAASASGLPRDSRTLYVRLWTLLDGTSYVYRDFTYIAAGPPGVAAITSPAPGSTLGYTQTFTWNDTGADSYELWIGSSVGASDLKMITSGSTSTQVTGLPFNGLNLYVRLATKSGTSAIGWNDYVYSAGSPAALISPLEGATVGNTQTFTWNNVGADSYQLSLSTEPMGPTSTPTIGTSYVSGSQTSVTRSDLPSGGILYARLSTRMHWSAPLEHRYYTFNLPAVQPAAILLPQEGSTLAGDSHTFQWNWGSGVSYYQLWVGSSPGTYDLGYFPPAGTTQTQVLATGLPTDGRTVYVRLWTVTATEQLYTDSTYVAATSVSTAADMVFPGLGGVLYSSQTFRWNAAPGAGGYQLWVGSSPGTYDVGYFPAGITMDNFVTATGLPTDGRRLFVRLWTAQNGGYSYRDYSYRAWNSGEDLLLRTPTTGWALPGPSIAFGGAAGMASPGMNMKLWIGSSVGGTDFGTGIVGGLQTWYYNLPVDGRALFARQSWTVAGETRFRDYEMTAAQPGPAAMILSPANDEGMWGIGTSRTFTFNNVGAASYKIWAGTTIGGQEYGEYFAAGPTSTTITVSYPAGRVPTRIRLWTLVDGVWYYRDYAYQHFSG